MIYFADDKSVNFPSHILQQWQLLHPAYLNAGVWHKHISRNEQKGAAIHAASLSLTPRAAVSLTNGVSGSTASWSLWITNKDKHRFIWCLLRYARSHITQSCRYPCREIWDSVNGKAENRQETRRIPVSSWGWNKVQVLKNGLQLQLIINHKNSLFTNEMIATSTLISTFTSTFSLAFFTELRPSTIRHFWNELNKGCPTLMQQEMQHLKNTQKVCNTEWKLSQEDQFYQKIHKSSQGLH